MSESIGIVDTTVIIHLYRKNLAAFAWLNSQRLVHKITPYTWLEVVYGAPNKRAQAVCIALMEGFEMVHPQQSDFEWAVQTMRDHRLSDGTGLLDCLIASICNRLQLPILTDNIKDYARILSPDLVRKPY